MDFLQSTFSPLPAHLERSISKAGRFLTYVEDDPLEWSGSFECLDEAIETMRWLVAQRLILNGAGCGAVLDDQHGIVVAVDQMPMPRPEDMPEAVDFIRSRRRT